MHHLLLLVLAALSAAQSIVIGNVNLTVEGGQAAAAVADPFQALVLTMLEAIGAKQDSFIAQQTIQNAKQDSVNAKQDSFNAMLYAAVEDLLASGFTLTSAANVKNCSRSSVFYITHHFENCSAFAYSSGLQGAQGTLLVSAAHCFLDAAGRARNFNGVAITAQSLASPPVACVLLGAFGRPGDSALLHCPGAAGTPPLRRRPGAAEFFQPVAASGFSLDALSASEYALPSVGKSLHIRLSHVGTTLGVAPRFASSRGIDSLGYIVAGVVEQGIAPGMSGGPVVDASCGVLGVNHVSLQSSGFAGLDEVDNHMSEMAKNSTDWAAST